MGYICRAIRNYSRVLEESRALETERNRLFEELKRCREDAAGYEERLEELGEELGGLRSDLDSKAEEAAGLRDDLAALEEERAELSRKLKSAQERLSRCRNTAAEQREQIAGLQGRAEKAEQARERLESTLAGVRTELQEAEERAAALEPRARYYIPPPAAKYELEDLPRELLKEQYVVDGSTGESYLDPRCAIYGFKERMDEKVRSYWGSDRGIDSFQTHNNYYRYISVEEARRLFETLLHIKPKTDARYSDCSDLAFFAIGLAQQEGWQDVAVARIFGVQKVLGEGGHSWNAVLTTSGGYFFDLSLSMFVAEDEPRYIPAYLVQWS